MTHEQKAESIAAIGAAVRHFHTQAQFAATIGKSTSHVSRLVAGDAMIDAVDAVMIEKHSHGKIARHRLRPDLWSGPKAAPPAQFNIVSMILGDAGADIDRQPSRERTADGKTRTGKRQGRQGPQGKAEASKRGRSAQPNGRQGPETEGRRGKRK